MKHTPTPWQYSRGNHFFSIVDKNLKRIAEVEALTQTKAVANGLRIISCVNALEGIENPEAIKELIEAAMDLIAIDARVASTLPSEVVDHLAQALANLKKELQ